MTVELLKIFVKALEPLAAASPAACIALIVLAMLVFALAMVVLNADKLARLLEAVNRTRRGRRS